MSSRTLLIHIGYHKTATTWLQARVFQPRNGFHWALSHDEVFDGIIAPHCLDFDPGPMRERVAAARAAAPTEAADVISLEALSGLPYDGGRESVIYARRLRDVVPEARILITIREQVAVLASVYMQYLSRGGTQSPRQFFDERPYRGYTKFTARHFLYDRLVDCYQDLFGAKNVLVLPLEMIATDQGKAVDLLARFSGNTELAARTWKHTTTRNVSYPQFAVPALRRANYFRREAMNPNPMVDLGPAGAWLYRGAGGLARRLPLPGALTRARPVTAHVRSRYADFFAESNRRLAGSLHYPVDLSGYQGIDAVADPAPPAHSAPAPARLAQ